MFTYDDPTATLQGEFTDGNPRSIPPVARTVLRAIWPNTIQRELLNVVTGANLEPAADDFTQLFQAIQILGRDHALKIAFPIGCIAFRPTDPGKPIDEGGIGFGVWKQIKGQVIVGVGEFTDTNGETRTFEADDQVGEFSHKLTVDELPAHDHDRNPAGTSERLTSAGGLGFDPDGNNYNGGGADVTKTGKTGSDQAHNNVQPSFVAYIWHRTG